MNPFPHKHRAIKINKQNNNPNNKNMSKTENKTKQMKI